MSATTPPTVPVQRLPLVDVDALPDDLREMVAKWSEQEDGDPNFLRTLGNVPALLRRFVPFYSPLVIKGVVEHRTKEIVRIDIAWHNQCRYCMATRYGSGRRAGIDEELVAEIARYETGPFSERERAALRYADAIVVDPANVPAEVRERLAAAFLEDERMELTWAICLWIETGRLFAALEVPYGADAPSGLPRRRGDGTRAAASPATPAEATAVGTAELLAGFARREGLDPRIVATLDHVPRRLERFLAFYEQAGVEPFGGRRLKDVLHARVAELDGLSRRHELPARAAELELPHGLADDARALVRFVDAFAVDYQAIPEDVHDDLRGHFGDAELTELLWTFAIARGLARVGAVLGLTLRP